MKGNRDTKMTELLEASQVGVTRHVGAIIRACRRFVGPASKYSDGRNTMTRLTGIAL